MMRFFPAEGRLHFSLLVLSGVMLGISYPPFPTGIFAAFAFVPLFIAFENIESYGRAFRSSYVAFFVFNIIAISWVGGFVHGRDPYLMVAGLALVLAHPLFMSIPMFAFLLVRKHLGFRVAVFVFPLLWTSFEYLHSITQLAFPWLTLGNTHTYDLAAIQFAEFTGVYGVSFWLLCLNVAAYVLYAKLALKEWRWNSKASIGLATFIVVLYIAPKIYGGVVMARFETDTGRPIRVGIVQPNIDPFEKWETHRDEQLAVLIRMTNDLAQEKLDLIVWPETAMPFYLFAPQNYYVFEWLQRYIDSIGIALFTGIPDVVYFKPGDEVPRGAKVMPHSGQQYETYNSSLLLQPGKPDIQKYAKMLLVPFGERVPFAEYIPFADAFQWNFGLGGWGRGTDKTVFELALSDGEVVRFSNLICYESIYPGFVAAFVRRGAEFLTIITNDSWWGDTQGPYQHKQFAVYRAIENRRWIVRCANGGISGFIDPLGTIIDPAAMFTEATIVQEIRALSGVTFYARHGDLFAWACLVLASLFLMASLGQKFATYVRRKRDEP